MKCRLLRLALALGLVCAWAFVPPVVSGDDTISTWGYTITAPGTYTLGGNLVDPNDPAHPYAIVVMPGVSGVVIDGAGFSIVGDGNAADYEGGIWLPTEDGTVGSGRAVGTGLAHITIQNVVFDALDIGVDGYGNLTDVRVEGCTLQNLTDWSGIEFRTESTGGLALLQQTIDGVVIQNNEIKNSLGIPVKLANYGFTTNPLTAMRNLTVAGNRIHDCDGTAPHEETSHAAVWLRYGATDVVIRDNVIYGNADLSAIWLGGGGGGGAYTNLTVQGNRCEGQSGFWDKAGTKPADGLTLDGITLPGTVSIQDNHFLGNDGYGVNNTTPGATGTVVAEYNWWGDVAGPTGANGDGVSSGVDYDPWHPVVGGVQQNGGIGFMPAATAIRVGDSVVVDVFIAADGMFGFQFIVDYDTTRLTATSATLVTDWFDGEFSPWNGVIDDVAGTVKFASSLADGDTPPNGTGVVARITFRGDAAGVAALSFSNVKLVRFVGGEQGTEVITPVGEFDGSITVLGEGTIAGTVRLQGRASHAGAVAAADGDSDITVAAGTYSLTVPEGTWTVTVEMARYLDAVKTGVVVTAGGTTNLTQVVLEGGDANDDDVIDILDAGIIGGQFGKVGAGITDPRADINADNEVDILDLVLMGGNYGDTSPVAW
ncbi:MAG: hypothetical protein Kow00123_14550 [Anaerolineales bacterium]